MLKKYKHQIGSIISFFLGLIFIKAGIEKFTGLPDIIGPYYLIDELDKYDLKLFGQFIAYSQLVVGFLLIHNRFRLLGSIMLFPMLLSILVVTISLEWRGTPYVVAFLLVANIVLLLIDFHKLKFILSDKEYPELVQYNVGRKNIKIDLLYLLIFIVILIGCYLGRTIEGKNYVRIGFLILLTTMIVLKIYRLVKRKTNT